MPIASSILNDPDPANAGENLIQFLYEYRKNHPTDDRIELYEIEKTLADLRDRTNNILSYISRIKKNIESLVMILPATALEEIRNSDEVVIKSKPLHDRLVSETLKICKNSAYADQPSALCKGTGFFVKKNVVATAAHVVVSTSINIGEMRFIRNLQMDQLKFFGGGIVVKKSQVYRPVQRLGAIPDSDYELFADGADWALIKVEPAFPGFTSNNEAFVTMKTEAVQEGERIYAIGHGLGLPLKVSFLGKIIKLRENKSFFECQLTLLGGSSGSPVFAASDHSVVGIYMRGTKKLILNETKTCLTVKNEENLFEGQECQFVHKDSAFEGRLSKL